ncbi:J517_1871 family lipoprotein [Pseudogulbenkiania sp. NH8B]|uniref:J517_1871 family lipoprotein n=1 Tax=Pseudogulbenkiania sp. (strain NH8B) TaxID=748280 RepID=UPI0005A2DED5
MAVRRFWWLSGLFLLGGCASPMDDMLNNRFIEVMPTAAPETLVGAWTGAMGPWLATVKLAPDGSGLMCSSFGGQDLLYRLKYAGNAVYVQDGSRFSMSRNGGNVIVTTNYFGGGYYPFVADTALAQASVACSSKLR